MFDMNKILVIGKNSFIGSNFARWSKCADIISHTEIDSVDFKNYNAVVNCCISPDYRNSELKTYTEDSPINPVDFYSENKFITEEKIRNNLEKYTILRGTNVFGNEYGRKSFMGFCLTQLKDNDKIIFNISGDIKRDFVHVDEVSRILKKVCSVGKNDTYNLSSGYGLTISDISKLLIAGKGSGEFECSGPILDQFILSNYKLCHDFDLSVKKEYTYDILMIGKKYG
jgi:nucleoside-diphosphate-sugar epimerase